MKASNELKQFLQDWLNWAEAGGVGEEFDVFCGLCTNSIKYSAECDLSDELDILFGSNSTPFGKQQYCNSRRNLNQHQDPNRLAWVRAALNDTLDTWELQ